MTISWKNSKLAHKDVLYLLNLKAEILQVAHLLLPDLNELNTLWYHCWRIQRKVFGAGEQEKKPTLASVRM